MFLVSSSSKRVMGSVAVDCSVAASRSLADWCSVRVAGNAIDIVRGRTSCVRRHCCVARDVLVKVDSGRVSDAEHR